MRTEEGLALFSNDPGGDVRAGAARRTLARLSPLDEDVAELATVDDPMSPRGLALQYRVGQRQLLAAASGAAAASFETSAFR